MLTRQSLAKRAFLKLLSKRSCLAEHRTLSAKEKVAHRFSRQLAVEHKVDADVYSEAESMFGRTGLVDISYLIGTYLLTCALLNAFEIPRPD